jgi:hypothetical protein
MTIFGRYSRFWRDKSACKTIKGLFPLQHIVIAKIGDMLTVGALGSLLYNSSFAQKKQVKWAYFIFANIFF